MADIDLLSLEEQNILLWVAEAELGTTEPLAIPLAGLPSERMTATVDRLARYGLLGREPTWVDCDHVSQSHLCAYLTDRGAHVVVELWRRRLRELPKALLSA